MYIMPYYRYEAILQNIYDNLNGIVNKNILAQQLNFSYNEDTECRSLATQSFGSVVVNIPLISEEYGEMKFFNLCGELVYIMVHELSHIEQDINPIKYCNDAQYHLAIETANNANALSFIFNNIDYLNSIWPDIKFDHLQNTYLDLKGFIKTYKRCSYYKYIENIFDGYLFAMGKNTNLKYSTIDNIFVENYNKHIIVKQNGRTNITIINDLNNLLDNSSNNPYMIDPISLNKPITIGIKYIDKLKKVAYRKP